GCHAPPEGGFSPRALARGFSLWRMATVERRTLKHPAANAPPEGGFSPRALARGFSLWRTTTVEWPRLKR
ncbi:MAG: hypothetical protein SNJ83_14805, partial [Aggregatilineales bacterium]